MPNAGPELEEDLLARGHVADNVLSSFFEYFNLALFEKIAEQTNLYSAQKRDLWSVNTNSKFVFTGIKIMMGTLRFPQTRMYWCYDLSIPIINQAMPRDGYFELRNHFHFADNTADRTGCTDKLWKISPFLSEVLKKCHTLPRPAHNSIDEQMMPFTGRCRHRQFVLNKPNPVGLKNFVLAARDGLVIDFHIYVGKGTVSDGDMKQFGLGASVVKLLCRTLPNPPALSILIVFSLV